jgi:gas vesicle protein
MAESKSDGLLGGLVVGVALGAIAGILAAPRPGRDTRRILKKSADALPELAEDLATSIQFQADRLSDTTLSNWDKTLVRLREAVSAGQAASRREWKRQQPSYTNDYSGSSDYSNSDGVTSLTEDE